MKLLSLGLAILLIAAPLSANMQVTSKKLEVPYALQAPAGNWVQPWKDACEETSILMVERFYQQAGTPTTAEIENHIQTLVAWENETLKKHTDTNAEETKQIIDHFQPFEATIKRNPTLEDIKAELDADHPVIALLDMYKLYGESEQGDSYHVIVLTGYDDANKTFSVQDPARNGKSYKYETLLNALHDYNAASKEGDGTPTVLFTEPIETSSQFNLYSMLAAFFRFFRNLF